LVLTSALLLPYFCPPLLLCVSPPLLPFDSFPFIIVLSCGSYCLSVYWCLDACLRVCGSYIVLSLLTLSCGFLVLCPPLRSMLVFVLSLLSHSLPLWAVSFWCLRLCPCLCACCACSGFGVFVCVRVLGLVSSFVPVFVCVLVLSLRYDSFPFIFILSCGSY
jgi:hypothetical protein